MTKIDKNVPLPKRNIFRKTPGDKNVLYPWRKMEVGDSFLISGLTLGARPPKKLLCDGCRFTQRKTDEGIRVWRLK